MTSVKAPKLPGSEEYESAQKMSFCRLDRDVICEVLAYLPVDDHLPLALSCVISRSAVRHYLKGATTSTCIATIMRNRAQDWKEVIIKLGGSRRLVVYAAARGDMEALETVHQKHSAVKFDAWSDDAEQAAVAGGQLAVLKWAERNALLTKPLRELVPSAENVTRVLKMSLQLEAEADPEEGLMMQFGQGYDVAVGLYNLNSSGEHLEQASAFKAGIDQAIVSAPGYAPPVDLDAVDVPPVDAFDAVDAVDAVDVHGKAIVFYSCCITLTRVPT